MRKISFSFAAIMLSIMLTVPQEAQAGPAYPYPIQYEQPDGSVVTLTLKGDEYAHWATSEDGYTLLSDESGVYEYAEQDASGKLKRSGIRARNIAERKAGDKSFLRKTRKGLHFSREQADELRKARQGVATSKDHPVRSLRKRQPKLNGNVQYAPAAPSTVHAPLILVQFPGKSFTKTKAHFEQLMNQPGATTNLDGETITGSLHDYFDADSYGLLDYQVDVFGPYTLSHEIAYYDDNSGGNPHEMAREAAILANADGCNFANYDINNDGIVDGIHIIFAGYDQSAGAPAGDAIWSHAHPDGGYTLATLDGKTITKYSCSSELRYNNGTSMTHIGIIAHELSHVFGLPDLYDTDYEGSGGQSVDLGAWDIMASGNWNDGGRTPALHSAWCRNDLGWVPVSAFTAEDNITLPNPATAGVAYRLQTKTPGEYFLLENRQQQGWDAFIPASGLLIYHVDENYGSSNSINCNPQHRGLYVKQAGGGANSDNTDRTTDPYPSGGNTNFTDTSTPNALSWGGVNTEQPITNISQNTIDKTVSFHYAGEPIIFRPFAWTLRNDTLTISGDGPMPDYGVIHRDFIILYDTPWRPYEATIKTIIIEEGITQIGIAAFFNRSASIVTSVSIPNSVTRIGGYAFAECTSLTSVSIPNSVTSIGKMAFANCRGLTGVLTIPNSVTSIGEMAFANCRGLTGVLTIPNSVTSIGQAPFAGCIGLTAINVNDTHAKYSSIDGVLYNKNQDTLMQCPAGKSGTLTIPNGVTSIGIEAFFDCSGLTGALTIPNSVTSIGEGAFYGCSGLTGELTIPNGMTSIERLAFQSCRGFTSVIIPNSVTSIGEGAFSGCSGLTGALTIPNSVTSIGESAFSFCSGLTGALTIPNSVTSIGKRAFYVCSGLTAINVNASNTKYSSIDGVLYNKNQDTLMQCPASKSGTLTIPNSVTSIGDWAFDGCSGLTGALTIPDGVTSIGEHTFSGCSGLTGALTIGNSVTSIGRNAFQNCSGLTSVSIPNGVISIGEYAFWGCYLTSVIIPKSVTDMGANPFSDCVRLTTISVDVDNPFFKSVDGVVYNKNQDTLIAYPAGKGGGFVIPNGVTSIGNSAFYYCRGLTSITIPESVTSIERYAFNGCSLISVIILNPNPENIIFDYGFPIFGNNIANCKLHVPVGTVSAYRDAENWNEFIDANIVEYVAPTGVNLDKSAITLVDDDYQGKILVASAIPANAAVKKIVWTSSNAAVARSVDNFGTVTVYPQSVGTTIITATMPEEGISASCKVTVGWHIGSPTPSNVFATINNDTLYFSGTGSMKNLNGVAPWKNNSGGNNTIKAVVIQDGVTSIGEFAFMNCSSLTSVTIPNSVTSIEDRAFERCSSLTSVTIPNSVTSIGSSAFSGCSGLTSVTIPNRVTSIGEGAFSTCSSLTSVSIPNNVTSIGEETFYGCSNLTTVTIGNGITSIGTMAFGDCTKLATVNFNPTNCTTMGRYDNSVFKNCTALKTINIGDNVKTIPAYAFKGCSGLTSIDIPNSVTSIENWAFENCGLSSVILEDGTTNLSLDNCAFCSSSIANLYLGRNITTNAFSDNITLSTLTIGNNVTSIGENAFNGCSGLTSVTIGSGVTSIGGGAFLDCRGLTSVTIGSGVTSIEGSVFGGCDNLTNLVLADGTTTLSLSNFVCPITSLYLGRNTSNANSSFSRSTTLSTLTIGNHVTSIESYAFYNCIGLTSVTIGNSVTSIGEEAFSDCSNLASITIPNSVTSIGRNAFADCNGLTSVTIPNSVTSMEHAFGRSGLTSVTILNSVIGEGAFSQCSGLTSVTIGNNVTSIGTWAFSWCSNLASITIPNSVTSIGGSAFYDCNSLTSVTIGSGVTSIGENAFSQCSNLASVTNLNPVPQTITSDVFDRYGSDHATLYVPASAVDAYRVADIWKDFKQILAIGSTAIAPVAKSQHATPLHAYPNPTTGIVYVDNANNAEIKVHNLNGELLQTTRESRVDLSGEPNGVYLLRIGEQTLKVVKQ